MRCLQDALAWSIERLTNVFATIIALCEPSSTVVLWERNVAHMLTNLRRRYNAVPEASKLPQSDEEVQKYEIQELQDALKDINYCLNMEDFGLTKSDDDIRMLPQLNADPENTKEQQREAVELAIQSSDNGQKAVINVGVREIHPGVTEDHPFAPVSEREGSIRQNSRSSFLDAPVRTVKTFFMQTIQSSFAVAACLLGQGRTAHSAFKILIPCDSESVCSISIDSKLTAPIRKADLIIMCARYCIEAVDRTLRENMGDLYIHFGGKWILFSRDCQKILPAVPISSRRIIVDMCLKSSFIFSELHVLHLTANMFLRALKDNSNAEPAALQSPEYLSGVGEGRHWRYQFSVCVYFAMTINKSQDQSVPVYLRIELSSSWFAHWQFYVALYRATHPGKVYVCIENSENKMKNIVYPEVLSDIRSTAPKFRINLKHSLNWIPYTEVIAPLSKTDVPHVIAETRLIDLDDDINSGSDYDRYELSLKKGGRNNKKWA